MRNRASGTENNYGSSEFTRHHKPSEATLLCREANGEVNGITPEEVRRATLEAEARGSHGPIAEEIDIDIEAELEKEKASGKNELEQTSDQVQL